MDDYTWPVVRGCDCPECVRARDRHLRSSHSPANDRAEELLRGYLTPEQLNDWVSTGGFSVRGSNKRLYRIIRSSRSYRLSQVISEKGMGTNVWCQEVANIPADNALGLMMYLHNNARYVERSGCHDQFAGQLPTDYGGLI